MRKRWWWVVVGIEEMILYWMDSRERDVDVPRWINACS